jgi:UDP-N-acetylglucosamine 4,6-dehydratase
MMIEKRKILITGGTGSFGNAVISRLIEMPEYYEIRVFSRDEKKQDDMRNLWNHDKLSFYIGDVRDFQSVRDAVKGVDFIFHAAALKQVPTCEFFPLEAVKTNILGTENVLQAALEFSVQKVVVLSTDKAAYPINAMGMSKALMEKLMVAKSRQVANGGTLMCGTRYGNVMASRGSVIPLFRNQILEGKPLTITDPEMTRFMMTLEDAVDLVLFAFDRGVAGDIFVQKAPSATIATLVEAMASLYGVKNDFRVIGTRHGEKLYETLVNREDMVKAQDLGNYFRIPADHRDLNYGKYFTEGIPTISEIEEYHSHNTQRLDVEGMKKLLLKLPMIQKDLGIE